MLVFNPTIWRRDSREDREDELQFVHVLYNLKSNATLQGSVAVFLHCTVLSSTAASLRQPIDLLPTPQAWRSLGHNVPTPRPLKTHTHTQTLHHSSSSQYVCIMVVLKPKLKTLKSNVHVLLLQYERSSAPDVGGPRFWPRSVETTQTWRLHQLNVWMCLLVSPLCSSVAQVHYWHLSFCLVSLLHIRDLYV